MQDQIKKALKLIQDEEPIIVPTDTVYGLVCRYDSKKAVQKIYKLKKRSRKKPLILLGYNWQALKKFVSLKSISYSTSHILQSYWPGPLTVILPASNKAPRFLNRGFKTIGIRVPNNKFLLKLLKKSPGQVLASTSANISGKPSKSPQKKLLRNIKFFLRAKKNEMSTLPSKIIVFDRSLLNI